MINRVRQEPSDDPFKRGKTNKVGGSNNRQVEKSNEVDPEERRKKFKQHLEEKKTEEPAEKTPSPYESKFYDKGPAEEAPFDKKLPHTPEKSAHFKEFLDDEQKLQDFDEIDGERHTPKQKNNKNTDKLKTNYEEKSAEISPYLEKEKIEGRDSKNTNNGDLTVQASLAVVPPEFLQRASEIASDLRVYLNSEISPLFEQMVGKILVMDATDGIIKTELILDNQMMEGSVFYGSKIALEKYSTDPGSFNIILTGSPEAVTAFNANIDILMETFHRGKFNFRIGRIEASHEIKKPLVRRKEPSDDSGDVGGGPLEK